MKVAIVYNLSEDDLEYMSAGKKASAELDFEPYYDIEDAAISSTESYELMARALRSIGYDAYTLNISDNYENFLSDYRTSSPDVVFNLVEMYMGKAQQEMNFASLLELLRIPYTGARPLALGTCQKKILSKRILGSLGISTPDFHIVRTPEDIRLLPQNYPMIVKPSQEDASLGIENDSVVRDREHLCSRITYILERFSQDVLVESYIDGREFNVAVIGGRQPRALPVSEVDFSSMPANLNRIVSYQAKWDPYDPAYHTTIPVCPAEIDDQTAQKAMDIAVRAFTALECRDYARVDMRLDKQNRLYILEVNPNPDLTEGAGFMRSARASGLSFRRALKKIVDMAHARKVLSS